MATLRVEIDARDARRGAREFSRSADEIKRDARGIGSATDRVRGSFNRLSRGAFSLRGAIAGLGIGLAVREFVRLSDAAAQVENRLRVVTSSASELEKVQAELFSVAQRTRTEYESTAQLYSRVALAAGELGASQDQLLRFTEGVGQAIAITGTSAQQAQGALLQLSQAIGGGVVRAEEFNSLLEGTPRIAQAVAEGLDRAGGSVARLRNLIINGEVSSREFFDAFLSQLPQLQSEFDATESTIGQALTRVQNELVRTVGVSNETSDAAGALVDALNDLADVIGSEGFRSGLANATSGLAFLAQNMDLVAAAAAGLVAFRLGSVLGPQVGIVLGLASAFVTLASSVDTTSDAQREFNRLQRANADLMSGADSIEELTRGETEARLQNAIAIREETGALIKQMEAEEQRRTANLEASGLQGTARFSSLQASGEGDRTRLAELRESARETDDTIARLEGRLENLGPAPDSGPAGGRTGAGGDSASKEAEKLSTALAQLQNRLDPVGAATREYRAELQLLAQAEQAGLITARERMQMIEQLGAATWEARNPLEAMKESLEEEERLLKLSDDERRIQTRLLEIENDLRRQGVALTKAQREELEQEVRAIDKLNEERKTAERDRQSVKDDMEEMDYSAQRLGSTLRSAFSDAATNANDLLSVLDRLHARLLDIAADAAFGELFGDVGGRGGFGGFFGNLFSFGGGGSLAGTAGDINTFAPNGVLGAGSGFLALHSGGVVGSDGFMRSGISPGVFAGAPRFHAGGITGLRPDEVPIIAQRGEEVLTERDPRHRANDNMTATPPVTVNFNVNTDHRNYQANRGEIMADVQAAVARAGRRNN